MFPGVTEGSRSIGEAPPPPSSPAPEAVGESEPEEGASRRGEPWPEITYSERSGMRALFTRGALKGALDDFLQLIERHKLIVVGISSASVVFAILVLLVTPAPDYNREEEVRLSIREAEKALPPSMPPARREAQLSSVEPGPVISPQEGQVARRPDHAESASDRSAQPSSLVAHPPAVRTPGGERRDESPVRRGREQRETAPESVPPSGENSSRPAAPREAGDVKTIIVSLQLEGGRVVTASVLNRQPGFEAYEASALRAARSLRYPPDRNGTESVAIKVRAPK